MDENVIFVIAMLMLVVIVAFFMAPDDTKWLYDAYGYMIVEDKKGKRRKVLLSPMTYEQRVNTINTINHGELFFWEGVYYNPEYIVEIHIVPKAM